MPANRTPTLRNQTSRRNDKLAKFHYICFFWQGLPLDEAASMLHQFEEVQQCPIDEVGTPVLELFLKKDANGELQQQGTVLSIPPEMLSQVQAKMGECNSSFQSRNVYFA